MVHLINRVVRGVAAGLVVLSFAGAASAQDELTTNEALTRLFTAEELDPEWFTEEFRAQLPTAGLAELVVTLTTEYGAFVEVTGEGRELTTVLEDAVFATTVVVDSEGRMAGLFFGAPIPIAGDITALVEQIAELPGETSVLVLTMAKSSARIRPIRRSASAPRSSSSSSTCFRTRSPPAISPGTASQHWRIVTSRSPPVSSRTGLSARR